MLNGCKIKLAILTLLTLALVGTTAISANSQESPGVITGRVTDEAGNPVANAVVKVSVKCGYCPWAAVEKYSADAQTDTSGSYEFEIPSNYLTESYVKIDVSAEVAGYSKKIQNVTLSSGQTSTVDFMLEKGVFEKSETAAQTESENVFMVSVGLILAIGVVTIGVTGQGKTIKLVLNDKLSIKVGVASFAVMAVMYLFLNGVIGGHYVGNLPSIIFLTIVMSALVGIVMALFSYSVKKCGIKKSKKGYFGFIGIFLSIFAACCGPVLAAFIGVGASIFLAQYKGVFTMLAIALLFASTILMTRSIGKEVCKPRICRRL